MIQLKKQKKNISTNELNELKNIELLRYVHCYRENFKIEQFETSAFLYILLHPTNAVIKIKKQVKKQTDICT